MKISFKVRIKEHFTHRNHLCIVYEILSFNLYEVLRKGGFQGLPLGIVRKFSIQILVNLAFLSSPDVQVIHCDLKPEKYLLERAHTLVSFSRIPKRLY